MLFSVNEKEISINGKLKEIPTENEWPFTEIVFISLKNFG